MNLNLQMLFVSVLVLLAGYVVYYHSRQQLILEAKIDELSARLLLAQQQRRVEGGTKTTSKRLIDNIQTTRTILTTTARPKSTALQVPPSTTTTPISHISSGFPIATYFHQPLNLSIDTIPIPELIRYHDVRVTYCGQIPRRVHFIMWTADENKPTVLNHQQNTCWQKYYIRNRNWQVFLWNRNRIRQLLSVKYPDIWRVLQSNLSVGETVDIARYAILLDVGGVYADFDLYLNNGTLDELLLCNTSNPAHARNNYSYALTFEGQPKPERKTDPNVVANAFVGASRQNEIMKRVLKEALTRLQQRGPAKTLNDGVEITGPFMLNDLFYRGKVFDRPDVLKIPKSVADKYITHYFLSTWHDKGKPKRF